MKTSDRRIHAFDSSLDCPLIILGDDSQGGPYVLRIRVHKRLTISIGRYMKGKRIRFTPGDYAYVGSALAERGTVSLARRLIRHASHTGKRPPHAIRALIEAEFQRLGLGVGNLRPTNGKHLKWNVSSSKLSELL